MVILRVPVFVLFTQTNAYYDSLINLAVHYQ